MPIPAPHEEAQRLAALRQYEILDTPPEQALDDITRLAAHVSDAPLALITFVDSKRQWFKSRIGFEITETAREFAFCAHAIARPDETLVVRDAMADERFRDNPLVTGTPGIRFYCGMPLLTRDGYALGTLCVMDRVPRDLTPEQLAALRALRRGVVTELELRRVAGELKRASTALAQQAEASLGESEERFRSLWETTTDAVLVLGVDSTIRYANPAVREVFGFAPEDVVGGSIERLQPERLREGHRRGLARFVASGEKRLNWRAVETRALRRDGEEIPVEIAFSTVRLDGEQMFVGFIRDIGARKLAEERLTRLNRVYAMLSGINTLIVRTRDRGTLLEGACRIAVEHGHFGVAWIGLYDAATSDVTPVAWFGADVEKLKGIPASVREDGPKGRSTVGRAIRERRAIVVDDFLADPDVGGERRKAAMRQGYRSKIALPLIVDGEPAGVLSLLAKEAAFFNDDELRLLSELAGDISFALEVMAKQERLDYLAYYDALTALPNRTLLHERLSQALLRGREHGTPVALVALDVKNFRSVNESLGRHAGDALLADIAQRLKRSWPGPDNLARVAGDAFAGFLTDVRDAAEIGHFLERTLAPVLGAPFALAGNEISIAVVSGAAMWPNDGADAEALLKNAEAALQKAKRSGDRYLFYQPSMNASVAQALRLESKLRRALDREQFVLHYQPKIDLAGRHIGGLEALLRWSDPEGGLVSPAVFVPVLEEAGLINEVGLWALRRASSDLGAWAAAGLRPPRVAVNISAAQLGRGDFVEEMLEVLRTFPGPGVLLDLEITESLLLDVDSSTAKLRAIREMGVRIAIDDFGTGHSSLVYLANLPVDALKIDLSFIARMIEDAQTMTIVSTIVSLAHSLGLKVIAEGVETRQQEAALAALGCDEAQGFLFARPMPAAEMAKVLAAGGRF